MGPDKYAFGAGVSREEVLAGMQQVLAAAREDRSSGVWARIKRLLRSVRPVSVSAASGLPSGAMCGTALPTGLRCPACAKSLQLELTASQIDPPAPDIRWRARRPAEATRGRPE